MNLPSTITMEDINLDSEFRKFMETIESGAIAYSSINNYHYFMYYSKDKNYLYIFTLEHKTYNHYTFKASAYYYIYFRNTHPTFTFFHGLNIENLPWLVNLMIKGGVI